MPSDGYPTQVSAFSGLGMKKAVSELIIQIQDLYLSDSIPWVVGYSGGKDSTAVLQVVWMALEALKPAQRTKQIYVITSDTQVENPVVAAWVEKSIEIISQEAIEKGLPIHANIIKPELKDSFWVNLIGKGYPAPRPKFRWCTERMKIKPADKFISTVVHDNGEAILVLGTRKAESAARKARMKKAEKERIRDNLNQHKSLVNAFVFAPIEDWSNDDVWLFLMQYKNPWGYKNEELLTMYQGASSDGECPLVIDTTTPSCGDSRFGCWVCTLVSEDKSMTAMIQNDQEKIWMRPLLDMRNALDEHDHDKRDFRRLKGSVQLKFDGEGHVPGPYTQISRADWLRKLLTAQTTIQMDPRTPDNLKGLTLISSDELNEIRRIWVIDKHEIEDLLPGIFKETTDKDFEFKLLDDDQSFGSKEMGILRKLCDEDDLLYQLTRDLLEVERSFRVVSRRSNLYQEIDKVFRKNFYDDANDALNRAKQNKNVNEAVANLRQQNLELVEGEDIEQAIEFEDRIAALDLILEDEFGATGSSR